MYVPVIPSILGPLTKEGHSFIWYGKIRILEPHEEQKSKIETTRTKDKAATGFAGNNIALDSQTAIRVMTSTEVLGDIEANIINANAGRAAWGYRMEGVQFRNEARTTRATAANLSPGRSAFNSLLGSAGNITESFVKLKKAGAFEKKSIGKTGRGTGKR